MEEAPLFSSKHAHKHIDWYYGKLPWVENNVLTIQEGEGSAKEVPHAYNSVRRNHSAFGKHANGNGPCREHGKCHPSCAGLCLGFFLLVLHLLHAIHCDSLDSFTRSRNPQA